MANDPSDSLATFLRSHRCRRVTLDMLLGFLSIYNCNVNIDLLVDKDLLVVESWSHRRFDRCVLVFLLHPE